MKQTVDFLKNYFSEVWVSAKRQWLPFTIAVFVVMGVYFLSLFIPPGWITYWLTVPASLVIAITALARANDIGAERTGWSWQLRKIGLVMAGAGAVMMMSTPFLDDPRFPGWRIVLILWGFAFTWITTPNMPPWTYYITGQFRFLSHPPGKPKSPIQRIIEKVSRARTPEELMELQRRYEEEMERQNRRG